MSTQQTPPTPDLTPSQQRVKSFYWWWAIANLVFALTALGVNVYGLFTDITEVSRIAAPLWLLLSASLLARMALYNRHLDRRG